MTANSLKVLHLTSADKFIPAFIEFIESNFDLREHIFYIYGDDKYGLKKKYNLRKFPQALSGLGVFIKSLNQADKIMLHGLFNNLIILTLFLQPWLLKKCYWIIWGGDLYAYNINKEKYMRWFRPREFLRRWVIKRIGHLVTYIKGDYELAQQWYGARGKYHECLMYPSNLFKGYKVKNKTNSVINILVGNSADPTNNHLDIFDKLEPYKGESIVVYTPLSYGDHDYAKRIIKQGEKIFGSKFIPITKFLQFEEYLELLANIDVAIFNHKRQQAMGNTITLLGLGKKVYMRNDVTQCEFLKDHGIKVFDVNNIEMSMQEKAIKIQNVARVKEYFSIETYKKQLKELMG